MRVSSSGPFGTRGRPRYSTTPPKTQLENFFLGAVGLTNKQVSLHGWGTAEDTAKHIRAYATSASSG